MKHIVVDRAENEKILLWIAQKTMNILVDRAENQNILLWIAQKMKHIDVERTESEKYGCGSRRKL